MASRRKFLADLKKNLNRTKAKVSQEDVPVERMKVKKVILFKTASKHVWKAKTIETSSALSSAPPTTATDEIGTCEFSFILINKLPIKLEWKT